MDAYQALGNARAFGVGIAFGAVFSICFAISITRIPLLGSLAGVSGIGGFIKLMIIGMVPFVSLATACYVAGKIGKGTSSITSDAFIAGVALLPLGLAGLVSTFIGWGNLELVVTFFIIATCLNILILFAGLTRISAVTEKIGAFSVPLMLIASFWISNILYTTLF
jgi:hypothetical protein